MSLIHIAHIFQYSTVCLKLLWNNFILTNTCNLFHSIFLDIKTLKATTNLTLQYTTWIRQRTKSTPHSHSPPNLQCHRLRLGQRPVNVSWLWLNVIRYLAPNFLSVLFLPSPPPAHIGQCLQFCEQKLTILANKYMTWHHVIKLTNRIRTPKSPTILPTLRPDRLTFISVRNRRKNVLSLFYKGADFFLSFDLTLVDYLYFDYTKTRVW